MSQSQCPYCEGEFHDTEDHICAEKRGWVPPPRRVEQSPPE